jgi:hypothetical protein
LPPCVNIDRKRLFSQCDISRVFQILTIVNASDMASLVWVERVTLPAYIEMKGIDIEKETEKDKDEGKNHGCWPGHPGGSVGRCDAGVETLECTAEVDRHTLLWIIMTLETRNFSNNDRLCRRSFYLQKP